MRIVKNDDTVEELTQGLESKESYVSTLVSILEDVGWIEQEPSGKYMITDKGNSGLLDMHHLVIFCIVCTTISLERNRSHWFLN